MAFPVRELGQYGIIKDIPAFDLPINAFSDGRNVIFQDGYCYPAPIFRDFTDTVSIDPTGSDLPPAYLVPVYPDDTSMEGLTVITDDFHVKNLSNGVWTDQTPAGWVPSQGSTQFTSSLFASRLYVNRPSHVPLFWDPTMGVWSDITSSGWDPTWRANILRGFGDYMIAIGVSKGATAYPNMFKWSGETLNGSLPPTWDPTNLTYLAGENFVKQTTGTLVDGCALRNDFILYTTEDCHLLTLTGDSEVFNLRRLFTHTGLMAPNCVVEWDGLHYVFGQNDIFTHDGYRKQSLVAGKLKKWLFARIDRQKSQYCFAFHYPDLNIVGFFYPTNATNAAFPKTPYCNEAILYNYVNSTWTIMDVPNLTSGGLVNADLLITWAEAQTLGYTWSATGGTWASQSGTLVRHPAFLSQAYGSMFAKSKLLLMDDLMLSAVNKPELYNVETPCYVERDQICTTSFKGNPGTIDIQNQINVVYPLIFVPQTDQQVIVYFESSPTLATTPANHEEHTFDPMTEYKVNSRVTGRFTKIGWKFPRRQPVGISGYDVDFRPISKR